MSCAYITRPQLVGLQAFGVNSILTDSQRADRKKSRSMRTHLFLVDYSQHGNCESVDLWTVYGNPACGTPLFVCIFFCFVCFLPGLWPVFSKHASANRKQQHNTWWNGPDRNEFSMTHDVAEVQVFIISLVEMKPSYATVNGKFTKIKIKLKKEDENAEVNKVLGLLRPLLARQRQTMATHERRIATPPCLQFRHFGSTTERCSAQTRRNTTPCFQNAFEKKLRAFHVELQVISRLGSHTDVHRYAMSHATMVRKAGVKV